MLRLKTKQIDLIEFKNLFAVTYFVSVKLFLNHPHYMGGKTVSFKTKIKISLCHRLSKLISA